MIKQDRTTTENIPDTEVISRVLGGEKDLYAIIVRRYNQRLYRIAMSIVDDDSEAEDIMQVAYIKAFENLGQFENRSVFSTWLTRILINESLLRLKKRKQSVKINEGSMNNELSPNHPTDRRTPLTNTLNRELKLILEDAIHRLPEKYRTVFIMREIENMNIAETKECLGISEVNVKVRLNRAKALLRHSLSDYYKQEDILHFHLSRCDRVAENVMKHVESFNV